MASAPLTSVSAPVPQRSSSDTWQSATVLYSYEAGNAEELSIQEGQTIKVLSSGDDGSGWIQGKNASGKEGLVPFTYIQIKVQGSPSVPGNVPSVVKKVKVLYDYEAQTAEELTIKEGDVIDVVNEAADGWSEGVLNGKRGTFPTNYAEPVVI
jgi:hypothetical protein